MSPTTRQTPDWLCEDSLQKIFESKLKRNCKILSVDYGHGSTAGDHYLSEIMRLTVELDAGDRRDSVPLIVKNQCNGFQDFLEEVNGVAKETEVYMQLVPYGNSILKRPVFADCYFISSEKSLVMDDLWSEGYRMVERRGQLDFEHSLVALRSLAEFHAVAVGFLEKYPDSLANARQETLFTERKDTIIYNLNKHCIRGAIESLKKLPHGKDFVTSLLEFSETFWSDCKEAVTANFDFKTLNHGDYWLSNTLFKYRDGKAIHCKIVDFQLTKFTTPCYDIHVLIATSIQSEVRDRNMDALLDEYLLTLNTTLKDIGSQRTLSRASLDEAMDRTKVIGILFALSLSPVVLLDPKTPLQLAGITKREICSGFQNGDPYKNICDDETIHNHIISLLNYFRKKKYI